MDVVDKIARLVNCDYHDPFEVLGPQQISTSEGPRLAIRVFEPGAREVHILDAQDLKRQYPMKEAYGPEFFEFVFPENREPFPYQLRAVYEGGHERTYRDPYSFGTWLTDEDLYLFGIGDHHRIYEKLGAHPRTVEGIVGVQFAVWAPNARSVSVLGDFNGWDGRKHPMRVRGSSGVWELFIPELREGEVYKYEIKSSLGHRYEKVDPYAFAAEQRPKTGSVIADLSRHVWQDEQWIRRRSEADVLNQPVNIYEVHLGSWMRVPEEGDRFLTYRELAPLLAEHVKKLGFTHVELMPLTEHPLDISWGYQVVGYYAPTSRYGAPEDFMYFVDHLHQNGIGVLMDWVPAHFPRDEHGLSYYDGSFLYEHADERLREHKDWGTLVFNFGRNEVRNFLIANALFWLDKYHLDGLRVDAVASMIYRDYSRKEGEWLPNCHGGREDLEAIHFLKRLNESVFRYYPGVMMIAEESTAWPGVSKPTEHGGLGFNFKWNMGWMNDFLTYISKEPVHRKYHQDLITFALLYAFHENFVLVLSHDEVTHGKRALLDKMPGDLWQKFANLRALLAFMYGHPGKKLLFMGTELGQWNEWSCDQSLDWHLLQHEPHRKLGQFMADMNHLYRGHRALWEQDFGWEGFEWIDFHDRENSVVSFIRWAREHRECALFVCNFTPVPRSDYRVGVPFAGRYRKVMDTDSAAYWGSGCSAQTELVADEIPWQGKAASLNLTLPPLSTLILVPTSA
ncbi:MAG: 1,4-alpha-glucan branching protein GlgB [Deltaproteobacteria bacterium]|nr:1,4-alpha-glucan branching protein GlgB [Deltaproteobacteria bacterium]